MTWISCSALPQTQGSDKPCLAPIQFRFESSSPDCRCYYYKVKISIKGIYYFLISQDIISSRDKNFLGEVEKATTLEIKSLVLVSSS